MEFKEGESVGFKDNISLQLSGRTLRVYWFLLNHQNPLGVREIQRGTDLSSASLAAYHLRKLQSIGLIEILSDGRYIITEVVRVGITRFYIRIWNSMIPRFVFYASFYLGMLLFILFMISEIPFHFLILLIVILLFGFFTAILETMTIRKITPS